MSTYRAALTAELANVTAAGNDERAKAIRSEIQRVDKEAPDEATTADDQQEAASPAEGAPTSERDATPPEHEVTDAEVAELEARGELDPTPAPANDTPKAKPSRAKTTPKAAASK